MITKDARLPFVVNVSIFFVGLISLVAILFIAQSIIVPFIFAVIIAILLTPIVRFLVKLGMHRVIAICLTLLFTFIVIAGFLELMISQGSKFAETWPALVDRFTAMLDQTVAWASGYFDIKPDKIQEWIATTKGDIIDTSSAAIGRTLLNLGNIVMILLLVPVYVFLILYYQPLLLDFIHKLFSAENQGKLGEIVSQTKTVIQRYLIGLVIEAILVATLNTSALLVLGIQYALLIGILGALLNVIPYLGGIVAVALPMMVAIATKSSGWYAVYILIAYYVIQLIDNNLIVPMIVASKVRINALFSIVAVFIGNAIWGISGMFLSIPLLAIIKLICDHIEPLKPWGFLLGDSMPNLLDIKTIRLMRPKRAQNDKG